jgi:type IV pilus assembly protein PilA
MFQRLRVRAQGQEGFTLIELLVVILIIGILAAVAIPAFLNQKGKANDANSKSDARTAQTAEETYFTDNQAYTGATANLTQIEPTLAQAIATPALGGDSLVLDSPAIAADSFGASLGTAPVAANSFDVMVTSKSNVQYAITRSTTGVTYRTCTVPSGSNSSGCTLLAANVAQGYGNGTW